jgi:hypothetical protein
MSRESKTLIDILKDTGEPEHARLLAQARLLTQCSCVLLHQEILSRAACSIGMNIKYEKDDEKELQMCQLLDKAANIYEKRYAEYLLKNQQQAQE